MLYIDSCVQFYIILYQYSQNLQEFLVAEEQILSRLDVDCSCDSDLNDENAEDSKLESETVKKLFDKLTPFLKTRYV